MLHFTHIPATIDKLHRLDSENRCNDVISVVPPPTDLHQTLSTPAHKDKATLHEGFNNPCTDTSLRYDNINYVLFNYNHLLYIKVVNIEKLLMQKNLCN